MANSLTTPEQSAPPRIAVPVPIVALDVGTLSDARAVVDGLPRADFFKVGLQLYTAVGPQVVRELKERGKRVFLDLKFHDIPNTVAGAVRSACTLSVDLLTVHAAGGAAMLAAAVEAAASAARPPHIFAVTILTSLSAGELAEAWGVKSAEPREEVPRLARLAESAGVAGVVASIHEVAAIRATTGTGFFVLTPGIRLRGDSAGDQSRIGTPRDAARLGVDFVVLGRAVTAAPDPAAAYERALAEMGQDAPDPGGES